VNPPATHGKDGLLYMNAARGGPLVPIALITEWSLDMATDKVESTALGDKNKTYIQGLKDLKGTLSGFWNKLDDVLFEAAESGTGVDLLIYPSTLSTLCFGGPAWLDISIKGGVAAGVTLDGSFSANGAWTRSGGSGATSFGARKDVGALPPSPGGVPPLPLAA